MACKRRDITLPLEQTVPQKEHLPKLVMEKKTV